MKRRNYGKWFLSDVKRTIMRYDLIREGDKVALGVSGGKDSSALLYILSLVRDQAPFPFSLQAVFVDLGWGMDVSPLQEICRHLEIPLHVEKTVISRIVFERKKEKNPCSLCAKLRRGALNSTARKLDCNRVALGHHLDDALQTFFLNLFHSGKLDTFKPHTYLDKSEIHLIRPLIGIKEKTLSSLVQQENLPVVENLCPVAEETERKDMEEIVSFMLARYPKLHRRFLTAMEKSGTWPQGPHYLD